MSKFLLLSLRGDGLGLALKLRQNGHTVAAWIKGKTEKDNFDGLITKVRKWEDFLDKETVVIFDSSGGGKTADRLRAQGHHVFAGSVFADSLELDRPLAMELLQQAGVQVPKFETFYNWEDGKAYAKRYKGRLVFKPTGASSQEHALGSYVANDPDEMVTMLDYFESVATKPPEFMMQEFIEGVAVSTEGYFNGDDWVEPFNHTIEEKAIMNDNLGPSSGCACNIVWVVKGTNFVIEEGLKRMAPILREYGHIGPVDLNVIANQEGVWSLEFTPRFGYDASPTLWNEIYDGDIGELIAKMARKEYPDEMPVREGFGSALRISIPPHPSEEFLHTGGIPIQGFTRSDRPHLYFYEIRMDRQNRLVSSRGGGAIVAITGYGKTINESFVEPYKIADRVRIPERQYRTDAEATLTKEYNKLQELFAQRHNVMKEVGGVPG